MADRGSEWLAEVRIRGVLSDMGGGIAFNWLCPGKPIH